MPSTSQLIPQPDSRKIVSEAIRPRSEAEVRKLRETVQQQNSRILELEAEVASKPAPSGNSSKIYIERIQSLNKQLKKKNSNEDMRKKLEKFADAFDEVQKRTDKVVSDTMKSCEEIKDAKERIKGLSAAKSNLTLQNDKLTEDVKFWRDGTHEAYLEKKELESEIAGRDKTIDELKSDLEAANMKIEAEKLISEKTKKVLEPNVKLMQRPSS